MTEIIHTISDIEMVDSPFEKITSLQLIKQVNEHVTLSITGIVPENKLDQYVERVEDNEIIEIYIRDGERKRLFFHGVLTNVSVQAVHQVRSMTLEAHSMTYLMDVKRKSRSYQNGGQSYQSLFEQTTQAYPNGNVVDEATGGKTTGGLIVQYKETDWEFLRRLASRFHAPLIPISTRAGVRYYVGVPEEGDAIQLKEHNYSVKKDMREYQQLSENFPETFSEQSSMRYEVSSHLVLELGTSVSFRNRRLYVYRVESSLDKGVLVHHYELREKGGFRCPVQYLETIAGVSLFGSIAGVSKDKVKVGLHIDKQYGGSGSMWFPYSTVYSSPDGSGWYCMPEEGDEIRLYFPDAQEQHAFAASSVDLDSSDQTKRSDPAVKSLSTKYGKQIVFQPGSIEIIANGQTLMKLTDDGGIELKSDKKIYIEAKEDIEITGGTKILIQGDEGVELKQGETVLTIQEEVTLSGAKVNIV